jgi:hypothetical protein
MRRRHFVYAFAAAPAVPSLLAQQPSRQSATPAQPLPAPTWTPEDSPKIEIATPDGTSEALPRFFTPQQFATLRKLCDVLMPAGKTTPGALGTGVPEFLDFLIGESAVEKQHVYRAGLDALQAAAIAISKYSLGFAEVDTSQIDALLAPLHAAWTYEEPSDPLSRFLREAKVDVRIATMNSREYSATASGGGRRGGGGGLYWYPLD